MLSLQLGSQQHMDCWADLGCGHHDSSSEHLPPTVPGSGGTLLGSLGTSFVHWFPWVHLQINRLLGKGILSLLAREDSPVQGPSGPGTVG